MKKITKKIQQRRNEKKRALYVRLPHSIKEEEDVAKLFTGNFKVNVPRQSSRYCYVIFPDKKEKLKNLKAAKDAKIDGKRVIVEPAITKIQEKTNDVPKKKIVIPKVKPDLKVTKNLFVSNIKCGTTKDELKGAMPGCLTVKLLEPYSDKSRAAIVKMESAQISAEYLTKTREQPIVGERKLRINPDTRDRHRRYKPLKIYDGETEMEPKFPKRRNETLDHIVLENKT